MPDLLDALVIGLIISAIIKTHNKTVKWRSFVLYKYGGNELNGDNY